MENRYLLISDLDGTLLGDDSALKNFAQWYEPRREQLRLVYSSGRLVESVLESVESTDLPEPDAVIGGVGTQIQVLNSKLQEIPWPPLDDRWRPVQICSVLSEFSELELQPARFLADHKISYYAHNATEASFEEIHRRLKQLDCHVEIVYSSNRDLDILPAGVNKGSASAHLASQWNFAQDQVIVSGDTSNDLAMFELGFCGIVVANAHDELREISDSRVFQASRPYAAGVQEGLMHWMAAATSQH